MFFIIYLYKKIKLSNIATKTNYKIFSNMNKSLQSENVETEKYIRMQMEWGHEVDYFQPSLEYEFMYILIVEGYSLHTLKGSLRVVQRRMDFNENDEPIGYIYLENYLHYFGCDSKMTILELKNLLELELLHRCDPEEQKDAEKFFQQLSLLIENPKDWDSIMWSVYREECDDIEY